MGWRRHLFFFNKFFSKFKQFSINTNVIISHNNIEKTPPIESHVSTSCLFYFLFRLRILNWMRLIAREMSTADCLPLGQKQKYDSTQITKCICRTCGTIIPILTWKLQLLHWFRTKSFLTFRRKQYSLTNEMFPDVRRAVQLSQCWQPFTLYTKQNMKRSKYMPQRSIFDLR